MPCAAAALALALAMSCSVAALSPSDIRHLRSDISRARTDAEQMQQVEASEELEMGRVEQTVNEVKKLSADDKEVQEVIKKAAGAVERQAHFALRDEEMHKTEAQHGLDLVNRAITKLEGAVGAKATFGARAKVDSPVLLGESGDPLSGTLSKLQQASQSLAHQVGPKAKRTTAKLSAMVDESEQLEVASKAKPAASERKSTATAAASSKEETASRVASSSAKDAGSASSESDGVLSLLKNSASAKEGQTAAGASAPSEDAAVASPDMKLGITSLLKRASDHGEAELGEDRFASAVERLRTAEAAGQEGGQLDAELHIAQMVLRQEKSVAADEEAANSEMARVVALLG